MACVMCLLGVFNVRFRFQHNSEACMLFIVAEPFLYVVGWSVLVILTYKKKVLM